MTAKKLATLKAADILRMIDDPEVKFAQLRLMRDALVRELVEALRTSTNSRQREILCYVLGKRQAKSAEPLLISCLTDPSAGAQ